MNRGGSSSPQIPKFTGDKLFINNLIMQAPNKIHRQLSRPFLSIICDFCEKPTIELISGQLAKEIFNNHSDCVITTDLRP